MDFNYTETQDMLRDTLSRFLADTYDFDKRGKMIASDGGRDPGTIHDNAGGAVRVCRAAEASSDTFGIGHVDVVEDPADIASDGFARVPVEIEYRNLAASRCQGPCRCAPQTRCPASDDGRDHRIQFHVSGSTSGIPIRQPAP